MKKGSLSLSKSLSFGALAVATGLMLSGLFSSRAEEASTRSPHPVVVELFTSQGCSSCPPADAVLSELSSRQDVIALSLPIDYWDNLGWRDTLASPMHTERQKSYARQLGTRRVYTPQMVINGAIDVVGSRREEVLSHIEAELASPKAKVEISLSAADDRLIITLGDAPASLTTRKAHVWIVPFHPGQHEVMIKAGENRGRTIAYANVVEGLMQLGTYEGLQKDFTHSLLPLQNKGIEGCAVIIQDSTSGAILGAQRIDLAALNN